MEHAGCCSFLCISWLTSSMVKAFRTGLSKLDLFTLPTRDQARENAERLERIWRAELKEKEEGEASLARCIWRFGRTRFLFAVALLVVSITMQFLGPVSH